MFVSGVPLSCVCPQSPLVLASNSRRYRLKKKKSFSLLAARRGVVCACSYILDIPPPWQGRATAVCRALSSQALLLCVLVCACWEDQNLDRQPSSNSLACSVVPRLIQQQQVSRDIYLHLAWEQRADSGEGRESCLPGGTVVGDAASQHHTMADNQRKPGSGLNAGASSFNFNPAVASWSPGGPPPAAGTASRKRNTLCSFFAPTNMRFVALVGS